MSNIPAWGYGVGQILVIYGYGSSSGIIASFFVSGARPIGPVAIRLTYSNPPLAFDASASNDALNPDNYTISGPELVTVVGVSPVTGDVNSVDIYVGAPLIAGTWTVTAADTIQNLGAGILIDPKSASFTIALTPSATPVDGGAVNEGIIRKHFNPSLVGDTWDNLIAALEGDERDPLVGDGYVTDLARKAYRQMFLSLASGIYLSKRAGEIGITEPENVGMAEEVFRDLATKLANERVTYHAIHDVLEALYSSDAVRATITTNLSEPFALQDGDDLQILFGDDRFVTIVFDQLSFARIGVATAIEVASAINSTLRDLSVHGFASAIIDPETGLGQVRVYADARGLPSRISILGGRAQVGLRFPTDLFPNTSSPFGTWAIAASPTTPGRLRFTLSVVSAYDLSLVQPHDRVLIYGREFPSSVLGTYDIEEVSVTYPGGILDQWFEVSNVNITSSVMQIADTSLVFLHPTIRSIHDDPSRAYATQTPDGLEIVLPVTTQVVQRENGTAAYLAQDDLLEIVSVDRDAYGVVTIGTSTGHGLSDGDTIFIDGVEFIPSMPDSSAGSASGSLGASHS